MLLLYEHYVYGLLYSAYGDRIIYQFKGKTGIPDFLYHSRTFNAILDTKYIPKYNNQPIENYVIRQLSGYGKDLDILKRLGYENLSETSSILSIPCVVIYPTEANIVIQNPFANKNLDDIWTAEKGLLQFFKIAIPLPTI